MAATPDSEDDGSIESDKITETANAQEEEGLKALEALLSDQIEAIDEDGEKLKEFIATLHFQHGVNSEASHAVQQVVRNILLELINEHEPVTIKEAGDALWAELLHIRAEVEEMAEKVEDAEEGETDAEAENDQQMSLNGLEELN